MCYIVLVGNDPDLLRSVNVAVNPSVSPSAAGRMDSVGVALDKVRAGLTEALASLQAILNDPATTNSQAIRANELFKSLSRFRAKV